MKHKNQTVRSVEREIVIRKNDRLSYVGLYPLSTNAKEPSELSIRVGGAFVFVFVMAAIVCLFTL